MNGLKRRAVFSALAGMPLIGRLISAPRLREGHEILQSFDARDWAKDFVAHAKALPGLATDEETMATWFANALMRGYDERSRKADYVTYPCGCKAGPIGVPNYCPEHESLAEIRGAVARGWCHDVNRHKEMDCDLGEAIVAEIVKMRGRVA